jgi:hypothetical protein
MDSIDITDSKFSLEMPNMNNGISSDITTSDMFGGSIKPEYTMYIYIGVAILLGLLFIFYYKYYQNKKNKQSEIDCPGGFCSMNQNPNKTF